MKLPIADGPALRRETGRLLRRHRRGLAVILTLHGLAAVAALAGPYMLGRIVDAVAAGTTTGFVDRAALLLIAAVAVQTVLIRFAQRASRVLGETVFAELREEFVDTVTMLPLSTVERAGTGDLVGRTTNDIDRVQHSVRFGVPRILVTSATVVLTMVAAFAVDWRVAPAMLLGLPLLLTASRWYLKRAAPAYLRESASYATLNGSITESVEGARTIDALGIGGAMQSGYKYALAHGYDVAVQVDGDGQHFGLESAPLALLARHLTHVGLVVLLHRLGIGFLMATHQCADHSLKTGGVFAQTPPTIAIGDVDLEIMTEQDVMPYVLRNLAGGEK